MTFSYRVCPVLQPRAFSRICTLLLHGAIIITCCPDSSVNTMDVKDDDKDVRLYRASGDLIPEIRTKLPQLVWSKSNGHSEKVVRRWVLDAKVDELIYLVSDPPSLRVTWADRSFAAQPIPRVASATRSSSFCTNTAVGGLIPGLRYQSQR